MNEISDLQQYIPYLSRTGERAFDICDLSVLYMLGLTSSRIAPFV